MNKYKSLIALTASIAIFGGCGGGSSSDSSSTTTDTDVAVSGAAIDGYLNGATVCLDIDRNSLCATTEPSTFTDATGGYSLTLTALQAASGAPLLVYGGTDVDTLELFKGRLKAPVSTAGTINITPLSTMVQSVVQSGATLADAEQTVADALGLDVTAVKADHVALYNSGDTIVFKAALTIQKAVEVMAAASVANGTRTTQAKAIEDIYADIAAAITTVAASTTTSGVADIITQAAITSTLIDPEIAAVVQLIQDEIVSVIGRTSNISDASLLIDATAEAVEDTVVTAIDANDITNIVNDSTTAVVTLPSVEKIAVANVFEAYNITITDAQITEIITAIGADSITAETITALTLTSSIGTNTVIASLHSVVNAAQIAAELAAVQLYLTSFGITAQTDATLTLINNLTGYSNTLTETAFVTLLRDTTDVALNAIADALDPPAPTTDPLVWSNIPEMYIYFSDDDGVTVTESKERLTFNNGTLTVTPEIYDPVADNFVPRPDTDDYFLNTTTGEWTVFGLVVDYTTSTDGLIITLSDIQEQLKIGAINDVSGQTMVLNADIDLNVTFSPGAKMYDLLFKETLETYELDWIPTVWDQNGDTGVVYTSVGEYAFAEQTCIYYKESTGECATLSQTVSLANDTNGNLVTIDYSGTPDSTTGYYPESVVGTWEFGNLPGQTLPVGSTVLTALTDLTFLRDDEDFQFITLFGGVVWIGSHNPADIDFEPEPWDDVFVNDIASTDIDAAIAIHTDWSISGNGATSTPTSASFIVHGF